MGLAHYFNEKVWDDSTLRMLDERLLRQLWQQDSDIQKEFRTLGTFLSYCRGLGKGARRLGNVTVRDEQRHLRELLKKA